MITIRKIALASAILGLAQATASAQSLIPIGQQALLAGWDFNNIFSSSIVFSGHTESRPRYSDVHGDRVHSPFLPAAGGIYVNGMYESDNWPAVHKDTLGDIRRDILTRDGLISTSQLGGLPGQFGAARFLHASAGTIGFEYFSINLHTYDSVNAFKDLSLSLWGRDERNTAGGATIHWFYSIDGGVTRVATDLSSVFVTDVYSNSTIDFSAIPALDNLANIYLIGQLVESETAAVLNLDNIGAYAFATIPEPSAYATILGALVLGIAASHRRLPMRP